MNNENKKENKFLLVLKKIGDLFVKLFKKIGHDFLHEPLIFSKYIICIAAIGHLILSSFQIATLSVLSNEICGIIMFMFILCGLVCMFNAIRLKEPIISKVVLSSIMLAIAMGLGLWLVSIYINSIINQANLITSKVMPGLLVSLIIILCYLIGFIGNIRATVEAKRVNK